MTVDGFVFWGTCKGVDALMHTMEESATDEDLLMDDKQGEWQDQLIPFLRNVKRNPWMNIKSSHDGVGQQWQMH